MHLYNLQTEICLTLVDLAFVTTEARVRFCDSSRGSMSLYSPCKQPSSSARQPGCGLKGSGNLLVLRFSDRLLWRVRKHAESFERWWMVLSGRFQCMGGGVQGSSFSLNSHSPALSEKRKKKKRQAK